MWGGGGGGGEKERSGGGGGCPPSFELWIGGVNVQSADDYITEPPEKRRRTKLRLYHQFLTSPSVSFASVIFSVAVFISESGVNCCCSCCQWWRW